MSRAITAPAPSSMGSSMEERPMQRREPGDTESGSGPRQHALPATPGSEAGSHHSMGSRSLAGSTNSRASTVPCGQVPAEAGLSSLIQVPQAIRSRGLGDRTQASLEPSAADVQKAHSNSSQVYAVVESELQKLTSNWRDAHSNSAHRTDDLVARLAEKRRSQEMHLDELRTFQRQCQQKLTELNVQVTDSNRNATSDSFLNAKPRA